MDTIAEGYVKLALELDLYDPDYVDAYNGPEEWKPAARKIAKAESLPVEYFQRESVRLIAGLDKVHCDSLDDLEIRRAVYLRVHLWALKARVDLLAGRQMSFDEESRALYDVTAQRRDEDYFGRILGELEYLLPGEGDPVNRYQEYRKGFIIPKDRINAVLTEAMAESRRRTRHWIPLTDDEQLKIEYVHDQPWGAYNWYLGNGRSLIQVNTDMPIYINSAVMMTAHEGYPGHHVQSILIETHLAQNKKWPEYTLFPLFAPSALLFEGGANYGVDLAFPDDERLAFERDVLYPLAGLDAAKAEHFNRVQRLTKKLGGVSTEVGRQYLDRRMSELEARAWLMEFGLYTATRAAQEISFYDRYRSYIVNYYWGEDLVRRYFEKKTGCDDDAERRWKLLTELFTVPRTPSGLLTD